MTNDILADPVRHPDSITIEVRWGDDWQKFEVLPQHGIKVKGLIDVRYTRGDDADEAADLSYRTSPDDALRAALCGQTVIKLSLEASGGRIEMGGGSTGRSMQQVPSFEEPGGDD